MNHADRARELFLEGYNCAQAVFCAFCDLTGLDLGTAARLASSFGVRGRESTCARHVSLRISFSCSFRSCFLCSLFSFNSCISSTSTKLFRIVPSCYSACNR